MRKLVRRQQKIIGHQLGFHWLRTREPKPPPERLTRVRGWSYFLGRAIRPGKSVSVYDAMGRRAAFVDERGDLIMPYGSAGKRTADSRRMTFTYDASGTLIKVVDPHSPVANATYGSRKLTDLATEFPAQAGIKSGLSGITTYSYDAGKCLKVINPLGQRTTFAYDADTTPRWTESTVNPLGSRTTYVYDANGSLREAVPYQPDGSAADADETPLFPDIKELRRQWRMLNSQGG